VFIIALNLSAGSKVSGEPFEGLLCVGFFDFPTFCGESGLVADLQRRRQCSQIDLSAFSLGYVDCYCCD